MKRRHRRRNPGLNLMLLAALAIGAFFLMKKKAAAAPASAMVPPGAKNVLPPTAPGSSGSDASWKPSLTNVQLTY